MNSDRVIGRNSGGIPWHYSEDLRRFARLTRGHTVIMGRKTFESINSKPLPKRRNIVISRHTTYDNVDCFNDIDTALADSRGDIWIIGGGAIYAATMDKLEFIDVTYVPDIVEGDDLVYFPKIDADVWEGSPLTQSTDDPRLTHRTFTRR